jgi:hypothetical protein
MSDDFDWVTARADCSLGVVFGQLIDAIRRDVAIRQKQAGGPILEVKLDASTSTFTVYASHRGTLAARTLDLRQTATTIDAELFDATGAPLERISGSLTLGDDGICRLKVAGVELLPWQFRRRALETLLFG